MDWQKEYNDYVAKTTNRINSLTAQLKETTDKLSTAENKIGEYRKIVAEQNKIIETDSSKLVDLVAYKLQHEQDEKDFIEVEKNAQDIVSACEKGFLTCNDCGARLPVKGNFVMYDPEIAELSDRHLLTVLCSKCAEQSANNV